MLCDAKTIDHAKCGPPHCTSSCEEKNLANLVGGQNLKVKLRSIKCVAGMFVDQCASQRHQGGHVQR